MPIKELFGIDPAKRKSVPTGLRGSGVTGGKGIKDAFFNQIILELVADHVVNTKAKVTAASPVEGTTYFNSTAGEFQDKDDVATVFTDGQKIVWAGLDTITAAIDLSAFDDIRHDYIEGVTIAFGSQNVSLGENQRGELSISGTGTLDILSSAGLRIKNSGVIIENNSGDIIIGNVPFGVKEANFNAKNLVMDFASNTTVDCSIDSLKLFSSSNESTVVNGISETFNIATDIHAGSAKNSHWYQIWLTAKYDGTIARLLVPDLTGVTDSTTAGSLEDSTADFVTDAVQIGDIVFNLTDATQTTVSDVTDLNTLELTDDIFVSGESYTIHIVSPTMAAGHVFKANIGAVYRGSDTNFDDFHLEGRKVGIETVTVFSGVNNTTAAARDLSTIVPVTAKEVEIEVNVVATGTDTDDVFFAPTTGSVNKKIIRLAVGGSGATNISLFETINLLLKEPQTFYSHANSASTGRVHSARCSGYKF